MKLVIIAGGLGSRFIEETITKPKPMITIGDQPIILHIMKYYASYGVNEFIICTGYKGELINSYFINFLENYSNIELDLKKNSIKILNKDHYNWKIKIIRSDENTNTGGRLLSAKKYINSNENFFFTYGDGLSNINIKSQLNLFKKKNKICLITGVKYSNKYGIIKEKNNDLIKFDEKTNLRNDIINGGFFILNSKIFNFINNKKDSFEKNIIKKLIKSKQIIVYRHNGFWQSMDNIRERNYLEELWKSNKPPWKNW